MPIARISLTNFKGISATTSIDLRPVTLLFGANSAGKSSVLQAMLYAREILERRNTDSDRTVVGGAAVDLGGFRNLVHKHDVELPIVLSFDLDLATIDLIDYLDNAASESVVEVLSGEAKSAWVQMTVTWGRFADEPILADYEVGIDGMPAAKIASEPAQGGRHAVFYNARHPWFGFEPDNSEIEHDNEPDWFETRTSSIDGRVAGSGRFDTLYDEIRFVLANHDLGDYPEEIEFVLLAPGQYLLHCLKQLRYVGPIRIVPDRTYQPSRSPDESRWSDGLAAWDWIHDASTTQLAVLNEWLTRADRLNTGYRVDVKHYKELDTDSMAMVALAQGSDFLDHYEMIQKEIEVLPVKTRILLRQERDFLDVMPQDVGIGISQVIPVVVSALIPGDGITIIEQPELHIHPAIQVALGDLFIQQTDDMAGTGKQFIIETHSEHLLLRLLRRMRETAEGSVPADLELAPDRVAVYYVEAGIAGTQIKNLGLNENGRFTDRWPRGFFEEREQEYFGEQKDLSEELGRLFGE